MMFKKYIKEIEMVNDHLKKLYIEMERISGKVVSMRPDVSKIVDTMQKNDKLQNIIESQQRTIEQLTNALMDKYEHGLFVVSEDGRLPMVIRNGKKVTSELTTYFSIDWDIGQIPTLTMEQRPATYHDMEV